jgi:hypothetical protein
VTSKCLTEAPGLPVKSARQYLDTQSFSKSALIEQLSSSAGEGFTLAQAQHAANKVY